MSLTMHIPSLFPIDARHNHTQARSSSNITVAYSDVMISLLKLRQTKPETKEAGYRNTGKTSLVTWITSHAHILLNQMGTYAQCKAFHSILTQCQPQSLPGIGTFCHLASRLNIISRALREFHHFCILYHAHSCDGSVVPELRTSGRSARSNHNILDLLLYSFSMIYSKIVESQRCIAIETYQRLGLLQPVTTSCTAR